MIDDVYLIGNSVWYPVITRFSIEKTGIMGGVGNYPIFHSLSEQRGQARAYQIAIQLQAV